MNSLLRDKVYDELRRQILRGVYRPGEQLSIHQLAARHRVSASPIREALTALQRDGLVDILPRVGCFVSQVTLKDITETFELRLILEAAAAELAAVRITEEEILRLEKLQSGYVHDDRESYLKYLKDNREFHYRVARASGNARLAEMVGELLDHMQRMVFVGIGSLTYHEKILDAHPRLIEALHRHDPEQARTAMVEGVESTRSAVLEQLVAQADLPLRR
jgi:DNA-binding GntR family transcriptional regulator